MCATEAAWKKARQSFVEKIGLDSLDDTAKVDRRAREMFKEMDADGNGKIDSVELKGAFAKMGCNLTKSEVDRMMEEADEDG